MTIIQHSTENMQSDWMTTGIKPHHRKRDADYRSDNSVTARANKKLNIGETKVIYREDIAHIELECDCGHAILQLVVDETEEEGYWDLYEMNFYTYQTPFWSNLKTNLELIWSIIRGRRFCLYGVIIPKEKMEEFKKFVADI